MDCDLIMEKLKEWQDDEKLFRDYFLIRQQGGDLEAFLERYSSDPVNLEIVRHPENIPRFRPEEEFMREGQNAVIVKHPRFLPLFFHEHAFFEIICVLTGGCTQHFPGRKISLQAGDLCLMAPRVSHGIEVQDESLVLNILIRSSTFTDIFLNMVRDYTPVSLFFLGNIHAGKRLPYMLLHTGEDRVIRDLILEMVQEQQEGDEYSDRIICSLLTIFFAQLIRRHENSLELPPLQGHPSGYPMLSYICDNYRDLSLEQVADHFHFSRQYCSRLIRDMTGSTFSELLTWIRLRRGENLLSSTSLAVSEISAELGYKNPETFIRVFKKHEGCTPAAFRKRREMR